LSDLEKTKFISDKFYSDSKAKNLIQRGTSINKIRNYLISKGIQDKYIKETFNKINENNEEYYKYISDDITLLKILNNYIKEILNN
jgi:regulatory protein